jgi:hypothetical protein
MLYFKVGYALVWLFVCVWLGSRSKVFWNDEPVRPILAPLVVIFIGGWYILFGVVILSPFLLWLYLK